MRIVASRSPVCAQYRTQVPTEVPIVPAAARGRAAYPASEANAARENERLATADLSASFDERHERRALELERRAAQQVQTRFRGGATRSGRFVSDIQAATGVRTERAAPWYREPVRDVPIDFPVGEARNSGGLAGEEVI